MVPEPGLLGLLDLDRVNEKHSERVQLNPNPNRVKENERDQGVAGVTQLPVTTTTAWGKVPHHRLCQRVARKE